MANKEKVKVERKALGCDIRKGDDTICLYGDGEITEVINSLKKMLVMKPRNSPEEEGLRKAKLPDGSVVSVHLIYADADRKPAALVEPKNGRLRAVPASWLEFIDGV